MNSILQQFSTGAASFADDLMGVSLWKGLGIERVTFYSSSDNADAPISSQYTQDSSTNSMMTADDIQSLKVIRPVKVEIIFLLESFSDFSRIESSFNSVESTISVISRGVSAIGMCIADVEVILSSEMTQAVTAIVKLEQAQSPPLWASFNPSQSGDKSFFGLGVQGLKSSKLVLSASTLINSAKSKLGF